MIYHGPLGRWPINQEGLADNILLREEAPGMRIGRVVAVVSQDEQIAGRYLPFAAVVRLGIDIGLVQGLPIHRHLAAANRDAISRDPNDALNEIKFRARCGAENVDGTA